MLVLGWGFVLLVTTLFITTVPETEARARKRQEGMAAALAGLRAVRADEQLYHRRTGHYANWLRLSDDSPPTSVLQLEARRHFYVRTSSDRQAYLSTQEWFYHDVACAEVVRSGPETAASRALDIGSWELVPNGPPRCRKTGFPWQWLHWAGIGYLDTPQVQGADD